MLFNYEISKRLVLILQVSLGELSDPEKNGVKKLIATIIKYGFAFISEVCDLRHWFMKKEKGILQDNAILDISLH